MRDAKRLLLCCESQLSDIASGSAVSTVELLAAMREYGWEIAVLTGSKPSSSTQAQADGLVSILKVEHRGLLLHEVADCALPGQSAALPLLLERGLARQPPDILLTHASASPTWVSKAILKIARRASIPSVFRVMNRPPDPALLAEAAGVIACSAATARTCLSQFGVRTEVVYPVVERARVKCPVRQPKYLMFIAPTAPHGLFFFTRLVTDLAAARPDIDILIVQGSGSREDLALTGVDLLALPNVRWMAHVEDPRSFLAVARVLLCPAVSEPGFARSALEAMISGVPIVASDRGGLPEVVGIGGLNLPIPPRFTPETRWLATPSEVAPWITALQRFWDDDDYYRLMSGRAIASSGRFDPDVMARRMDELLVNWSQVALPPLLGADVLEASGFPGDSAAERARMSDLLPLPAP